MDLNTLKRSSDGTLAQHIFKGLKRGNPKVYKLINTPVNVTEKMDGTQIHFTVTHDNKINNFQSHNGLAIGTNEYKLEESKEQGEHHFQNVNMTPYFESQKEKYFSLFKYFKSLDSTITHIRIFVEMMLPISPLQIDYSDENKNKFFIFQIITSSKKSYRIDGPTEQIIKEIGLTPVPFLGSFKFTKDLLDYLIALLNPQIEGWILEFPELNFACKLKNGQYNVSTWCDRFTESMKQDKQLAEIIKSLIQLSQKNVTAKIQQKRIQKQEA